MNRTFGEYLREWRVKADYTQRELAAAVAVDHTYLSKLERGRCLPPSAKLIGRIAKVLGADEEKMLVLACKPTVAVLRRENEELRRVLQELWLLVAGENCGCVSCLEAYRKLAAQVRPLVGQS